MSRFHTPRQDAISTLKRGIQTRNERFNRLIAEIERVAVNATEPILLLGPTGAGKTDLAQLIYNLRKQRGLVSGDLVSVNCATLRGETALSAWFGHLKGSFTGAVEDRQGFILKAHKGVLFLDEIADLRIEDQSLLLRALDQKKFSGAGSDEEIKSDFQLIAATNRNLRAVVRVGTFREDLWARIKIWSFSLPALVS